MLSVHDCKEYIPDQPRPIPTNLSANLENAGFNGRTSEEKPHFIEAIPSKNQRNQNSLKDFPKQRM
jgi:hypothetical protein